MRQGRGGNISRFEVLEAVASGQRVLLQSDFYQNVKARQQERSEVASKRRAGIGVIVGNIV